MQPEKQFSETPTPGSATTEENQIQLNRKWIWGGVAVVVLLLAGLIALTVYLLSPGAPTTRIRDVVIVLLALEGMLIGLALVVLLIQIAVLINLLQNEVRPILDSTTKTVNVLQGTVAFLSNHMVEPVIKLNETVAALSSVAGALNLVRGRKRKSTKGE